MARIAGVVCSPPLTTRYTRCLTATTPGRTLMHSTQGIMGRLIPAGTGCRAYSGIRIEEPEMEEPEKQPEEESLAIE